MYSKRTLLMLSVSCLGFASPSFANGPLGKAFNDTQATVNYWTSDRLQQAKPFPLPLANRAKIKLEHAQPQNETSIDVPGSAPTFQMKPDATKLFEPKAINLDTKPLKDVGTGGIHFSSSQLVPLSADQTYPYRTVGKLFFTIGSDNYVCSASVIAKRLVVTAGHCVHSGSGETAGFYTNFLFIPAFRDGTAPYTRWTAAYVNTTSTWMTGGGVVPNAGDFALLEMNDNTISGEVRTIGSVTGYLGFTTNKATPNHLHLLGYPCNFDKCAKMHQVTSQNGESVSPNNVSYGSDMKGGSSGGPWIQNFGEPSVGQTGGLNPDFNRVVAVTSWGYTSLNPKVQGAAIFDSTFSTLYNDLCNHKAGNCK